MKKSIFSKVTIFAMSGFFVLLALLFFVSSHAKLNRQLANLPAVVLNEVSQVLRAPQDGLSELKNQLGDLFQTYDTNQVLKKRLVVLENQDVLIAELQAENEQLRESLGIAERFSSQMALPAHLISRSSLAWFDLMMVNKGSQDGVVETMLVVTEDGLVGTINQLTDQTAQVELVTNALRQRPVAIQITSGSETVYGMLLGYDPHKKALKLGKFNRQLVPNPGDQVVTSGLDGTGIADLSVGRVLEVTRDQDQALVVYAIPAVDVSELATVTIIGGERP